VTTSRVLTVICLISAAMMWSHTAVQAADGSKISQGTQVTSAEGSRLGQVYRVNGDGSVQIILDGRMVTIPASTLSTQNGRVTTSLKKPEVLALK
jgi:hypothetical protein